MRGVLARAAAACAAALAFPTALLALPGDVTNDGVFDLRDPLALCQFLSGTIGSLPAPRNADLDYDGSIDEVDLDLMMDAVVGAPLPPAPLSAAPPAVHFGDVTVGDDASLDVTLTNGGANDLTLESVALGPGGSSDFTIVAAPPTPFVLGPGSDAVVTVRYAPSGTGADAGTLQVLSTGGDVTVALDGAGVAAGLVVTPLVLDFGDVAAGDESLLDVTLENGGGADLEVTSIAPGPGTSPDFSIVSAPATPFVLAPGASASFTVRYAPSQGGDDAGSIEILASTGAAAVALSGRGLAPALDVNPLSLGFGNVLAGASKSLSFDVTNTGSAPLTVSAIALELGTSADFALSPAPAVPFDLPPGGTRTIDVVYTPSGVGPDAGHVEVHTAAGDALVSLDGAGVAPDIQVVPSSVGFGNVMVGGSASLPVEIRNVGTADLTVSSIALAPGGSADLSLAGVPATPLVLAPGTGATVDVVYAPQEVGPDAADLVVGSDDPDSPSVQAPIGGNGVSPSILIQPNTLAFSNVRAGQSLDLDFTITNSGTSDLTVNSLGLAAAGSPDFSLVSPPATPFVLGTGGSAVITVRYAPATGGSDSGTVEIGSSAGAAQVALTGSGIAPEIDVSPAALDFGNVKVGSQAAFPVTIRNLGSAPLTLSALGLGGGSPDFSLAGAPALPAVLAPGGSLVLDVGYAPGGTGPDADQIQIASDDDDEPSVGVALAGNGVVPILSASPPSLGFGDVTIGTSSVLAVTIQNTGTGDLAIASVSLGPGSSGDFSAGVPGILLVPPSGSTTVNVTYTPAGADQDSGSLEIVTDGGSASIPLSGRGVVGAQIADLMLARSAATLAEGTCLQLRAFARLTDSTTVDVTGAALWSSLDPNVASVGTTGLVTGAGAGATQVSASLGGFTAAAGVTVVAAGTLRLDLPCGETAAGATFQADLTIDAASRPLGAYAIEVVFDPAVLRVVSIEGGSSPAFADAPGADPSDFASGIAALAAYQDSSLSSPAGAVGAARITFEVVGPRGAEGAVSLRALTLAATDLSDLPWTNVPALVQVAP